VTRSIPEIVGALRRYLIDRAYDPTIVVEELRIASPAPAALIARHRGVWPDDLLDFWALVNGVRFRWHRIDDPRYAGTLNLAALDPRTAFYFGFPGGWYLPLDDDESGFTGCYWSENGRAPFAMAHVERGNEVNSRWPVCPTFAEYLELAMERGLLDEWQISRDT
jgi:hypothetical protein